MVLYSFQPRFIHPIQAGVKQQTIRLPRKRHARPGEALQFTTGPRMRPDRVGYAICQEARECRVDFQEDTVTLDDAELIAGKEALDAFATLDGFGPDSQATKIRNVGAWDYMRMFWRMTHPDNLVFLGVMIRWGRTFSREPWEGYPAAPRSVSSQERADAAYPRESGPNRPL